MAGDSVAWGTTPGGIAWDRVLVYALLLAIAEELTFRGVLPAALERLVPRDGMWVATLACATLSLGAALPWWVRAAAQPATALACVLGGLVVWKPEALQSAAAAALAWLQGAISTPRLSLPTLPHPYGDPLVQLGLALAALPFAAWAGWALYRWSERLVCPPGPGLGHRV